METVLRLAVPGNLIVPWERLVRGCLVMAMFGMLCFGVLNCTENLVAEPEVSAAGSKGKEGLPEDVPADITGNMKSTAGNSEQSIMILPDLTNNITNQLTLPIAVQKQNLVNSPETSPADAGNKVLPFNPGYIGNTDKNNAENITPVVDGSTAENTTPIIGEDNIESNIPAIDTNHTGNNIPTTDTDYTENNIPSIDTDHMGNDVPTIDTDDTDHIDKDVPTNKADDETLNDSAAADEDESDMANSDGREFMGFMIDSEGYITGMTDSVDITDGILVIAWDPGCIGIRSDALTAYAEYLEEIYIPANIRDIEPGTFDVFSLMTYFEVATDNPCYYSENGFLYSK